MWRTASYLRILVRLDVNNCNLSEDLARPRHGDDWGYSNNPLSNQNNEPWPKFHSNATGWDCHISPFCCHWFPSFMQVAINKVRTNTKQEGPSAISGQMDSQMDIRQVQSLKSPLTHGKSLVPKVVRSCIGNVHKWTWAVRWGRNGGCSTVTRPVCSWRISILKSNKITLLFVEGKKITLHILNTSGFSKEKKV